MKFRNLIMIFILSSFGFTAIAQDEELKSENDTEVMVEVDEGLLADAQEAKAAIIKENKTMETYFNEATAYAIFPNVGKGALIVGVASGKGVVYSKGKVVGISEMKQVDVGAQIGGEAYREVIFFNTDEAIKKFKQNELAFTAGVSATLIKAGKSLGINFQDGVAVAVMPKAGLMAEASVGGQRFEYKPINE